MEMNQGPVYINYTLLEQVAFTDTCILKCRFYYHSIMVRPRDQEMITMEKIVTMCHVTQGHV